MITTIATPPRPMITALPEAATAHPRQEEALVFEHLIADLAGLFVDASPEHVEDQMPRLLTRIADVLDLDQSHLAQRRLNDAQLRVTHQWTREGLAVGPPRVSDELANWIVVRLNAGTSVMFSSPDDLPPELSHERMLFDRHGPHSMVLLPMTAGDAVIGGMTFGCVGRRRSWDAHTIGRLRIVTRIVGGALARTRTNRELRTALQDNEDLRRRLVAESVNLRGVAGSPVGDGEIVGRSPAIRAVLHKIGQVAATDVPVLLLGETGTGKELIARAIHEMSARNARPLITVNCAALPPSLVESELFGHEKGAFTGATQARLGRFELADGGTLFLDEIGDLEPALQAKLLRTLQGGEIERLGSSRPHKVNVRVIAATNRDLGAAMDEGRFRTDLYYRLSVFPVEAPALRDRREDIPLLVWHFIQSRQRGMGRLVKEIPQTAMDALVAYDWPGNVRELQNVIDRALILTTGSTLCVDEALGGGGPVRGVRSRTGAATVSAGPDDLAETERAHIVGILQRCGWAVQGSGNAAERLGLRPSTLRNRMRKLGIRRPRQG